eukprot:Rhum_TRINITY_DN13925_c5_g1::Rhum_TRINITY_DN13925_c5_g1_i1::g.65592::m.65592
MRVADASFINANCRPYSCDAAAAATGRSQPGLAGEASGVAAATAAAAVTPKPPPPQQQRPPRKALNLPQTGGRSLPVSGGRALSRCHDVPEWVPQTGTASDAAAASLDADIAAFAAFYAGEAAVPERRSAREALRRRVEAALRRGGCAAAAVHDAHDAAYTHPSAAVELQVEGVWDGSGDGDCAAATARVRAALGAADADAAATVVDEGGDGRASLRFEGVAVRLVRQGQTTAAETRAMLARFGEECPSLRAVLVVLQVVLQQCHLFDVKGGLDLTTLAVMVMAANARLKEAPTPARLMMEFLAAYGWAYDYQRHYTHLPQLAPGSPWPSKPAGSTQDLTVISPIRSACNLAGHVSKSQLLRATFQYCYISVSKWENGHTHHRYISPLANIIAHKKVRRADSP